MTPRVNKTASVIRNNLEKDPLIAQIQRKVLNVGPYKPICLNIDPKDID